MSDPKLSLILPYYKRVRELARVLPLNVPYLTNPECEVVLVLDEPSEERDVLAIIRENASVRWRVLVNDEPHSWRPPNKAYNVGLRHSLGEYVMVSDPESAFLTDAISVALDGVRRHDRSFVLGWVSWATFRQAGQGAPAELEAAFELGQRRSSIPLFYGSLCTRREHFEAITGYDESLAKWGGSDDNLRLRLLMSGLRMVPEPDLKLLHLGFEPRLLGHASRYVPRYTREEKRRITSPRSAAANRGDWGRDFERVAFDWAVGPGSGTTGVR